MSLYDVQLVEWKQYRQTKRLPRNGLFDIRIRNHRACQKGQCVIEGFPMDIGYFLLKTNVVDNHQCWAETPRRARQKYRKTLQCPLHIGISVRIMGRYIRFN